MKYPEQANPKSRLVVVKLVAGGGDYGVRL